jgi:hypothetical protein
VGTCCGCDKGTPKKLKRSLRIAIQFAIIKNLCSGWEQELSANEKI